MLRPTRERLAWLAMTAVLGLEIRFDRLRILNPVYKAAFQLDSDALVRNRMRAPSALLGPLVLPSGQPYLSQFGLQGIVLSAFSPGDLFYGAFRMVTAFLCAAVIATAVIACWRAWGGRAAAVLLALLSLSTWLNVFGASTYWQLWTMFLPTLVPLLAWRHLGTGRKKWWGAGALIAGLVFLKCLCGYEYVTTVILGAVAAVAFHEFRGSVSWRFSARLGAPLLAGLVGFAAALAVHVTQLMAMFGDASIIQQRMRERTYAPSDFRWMMWWARHQHDAVWGWLVRKDSMPGLWAFQMAHYLTDSAVALPGPSTTGLGPAYGIPIWMFIVLFVLLAWQAWRGRQMDAGTQRRLAAAGAIGLVGALSWQVLAYGHMIHHPHLDAIVFYLPFLPIVFAMVALRVETISRRAWPVRVAPNAGSPWRGRTSTGRFQPRTAVSTGSATPEPERDLVSTEV